MPDDLGADFRLWDRQLRTAELVIVTDQQPGLAADQDGLAGLSHLLDDPVTGALAAIAGSRLGTWLGRPRPHPPTTLRVPLVSPSLGAGDVADYHDGHARQTIWPLYHDLARPAVYHSAWRDAYRRANLSFAESVAAEAADGATVWVHDYHLQLVPAQLRQLRPDLLIGFFLHTGFPSPELFMRMPMRQEILGGLLGADLVGFQTAAAAENFLRLTHHRLAMPSLDVAPGAGAAMQVGVFPTAADAQAIARLAATPGVAEHAAALRADLGSPPTVVLSVDPSDESSGIERRLRIIGELLTTADITPSGVAFIQIVADRADTGTADDKIRDRIGREIARINGQFASVGRPCVHYVVTSPNLAERVALYRAADIMMATPLCDGTHLPALEYAAARNRDGALILSESTGAASTLLHAFMVNPYDDDQVKAALLTAMVASPEERRHRMEAMHLVVRGYDNHDWALSFLNTLDFAPTCVPVQGRGRTLHPRLQKPRLGQRPAGHWRRRGL